MSKLKKYIKFIAYYLCLYLSMFYPRDGNTFICGAWLGKKYDDNPKYFYEYLVENRPDIKAFWLTSSIEIYNRLLNEKKPVCMSNSFEAIKLCLRAKYVCTATGKMDIGEANVKYLGNAHYINFWHGIPLKKIMYDDEYSECSKRSFLTKLKEKLEYIPFRKYFVVSTSDKITEIYKSAFRRDEKHILQLGQPRNDYFYIEHDNPYKKRFSGKRIILYMPTHRNEGKTKIDLSEIFVLDRLNELCIKHESVFLVKKHFYHLGEQVIKNKFSSILEITEEVAESQVLLDAADILITDYSSCYIDYLLLDRPIIFYNFDLENYLSRDRKMYFDYNFATPGFKCRNYAELNDVLETILSGTDGFKNDRKKICNLFYDRNTQSQVSPEIIKVLTDL